MRFSFSSKFVELISSEADLERLLAGSGTGDCDFFGWTGMRAPIVEMIAGPGRILDVGCGNGFLLRCLSEWSEHRLEAYGIDNNTERLSQVKECFPETHDSHFANLPLEEVAGIADSGLPAEYQTVFHNVPTAYWGQDDTPAKLQALRSLVASGGRLILGFYGQNGFATPNADWKAQRDEVQRAADNLAGAHFSVQEMRWVPSGLNNLFCRIDC